MGPFDHIQKKGSKAITPHRAQIRKELVSAVSTSSRKTLMLQRSKSQIFSEANNAAPTTIACAALNPFKPSKKQPARKRALLVQSCPGSASDNDNGDNDDDDVSGISNASRKRPKTDSYEELDFGRQVCRQQAFVAGENEMLLMVHAAEIANIESPTKYKAAFPKTPDAREVFLQYPSASKQERYVWYWNIALSTKLIYTLDMS